MPGAALVFTLGHLLVLAAVAAIGVTGSAWWLAPGLAVSGLGMGVCLSSLVGSVMAGVEPQHAATVSGTLSMVQQIANALVIHPIYGEMIERAAKDRHSSPSAYDRARDLREAA